MRWRIEHNGEFLRFVDADDVEVDRHAGTRFLRGGVVVARISWSIYCTYTVVPTAYLVHGPFAGQVAMCADQAPGSIWLQQSALALNSDGTALAPTPPAWLPGLIVTYRAPPGVPLRGQPAVPRRARLRLVGEVPRRGREGAPGRPRLVLVLPRRLPVPAR